MDRHGSHLTEYYKWFCWKNKILPFLLPSHSTYLLQSLDVGVFSAMKQHHQNSLYESIRFGDYTFEKTNFITAFKEIYDKTMRKHTIVHAWEKVRLWLHNPSVAELKIKEFESQVLSLSRDPPLLSESRPSTPINLQQKPFQNTPNTHIREVHEKYLNVRVNNHFEGNCPLTPSFQRAVYALLCFTTRKYTEVRLIEKYQEDALINEKEKQALKASSGKYVQRSGLISFREARAQIQERETEEWLAEGARDIVNIAANRIARKVQQEKEKSERILAKEAENQRK
jgi:hypothetical protein